MYIAICDNNTDDLETLTTLILKWQAKQQTVCRFKTFHNADELLDAAKNEAFSLYILDAIMSGTNGIATAKEIRSIDTVADILFLTASPNYAYESYEVNARNYLLKPIQEHVLFPILDQLLLQELQPQEGITLKIGNTLTRILFSQLEYVEVNHKHLYFNLINGQVYQVFGALKDYESVFLMQPEFARVHRSYIINMMLISELRPFEIRTLSGKRVPVSRNAYPHLQKKYIELLFAHRCT